MASSDAFAHTGNRDAELQIEKFISLFEYSRRVCATDSGHTVINNRHPFMGGWTGLERARAKRVPRSANRSKPRIKLEGDRGRDRGEKNRGGQVSILEMAGSDTSFD